VSQRRRVNPYLHCKRPLTENIVSIPQPFEVVAAGV
jgi:hypothetical protein